GRGHRAYPGFRAVAARRRVIPRSRSAADARRPSRESLASQVGGHDARDVHARPVSPRTAPRRATVARSMRVRSATPAYAAATARIYNEGIDDRVATFETAHRSAAEVRAWFTGSHPIVVVEGDDVDRRVIAFASTSTYRPRECYRGIAEFS